MPREQADLVNVNFSKGLITETGPLGYPANSCKDLVNIKININGSASVRGGLMGPDVENAKLLKSDGSNNEDNVVLWEDPAGDGTSFLVTIGPNDLNGFTYCTPIEETGVQQTGLIPAWTLSDGSRVQLNSLNSFTATQVGGDLLLYNGTRFIFFRYFPGGTSTCPAMVEAGIPNLTTTPSVEWGEIELRYRKLDLYPSGLSVMDRPTTLSLNHKKNLENGGWTMSAIQAFYDYTATEFNTPQYPAYPSVSDRYLLGYKNDSTLDFEPKRFFEFPRPSPTTGILGHYILDMPSGNKPRVAGTFAGRMWYSGFEGDFSESVMFTQVLPFDDSVGRDNKITKPGFGQCLQGSDPTSREINDLVDSDGGVVQIPGLGKVLALESFSDGILVMSSKGVWFINGGLESFSANNYVVQKITDTPCLTSESVVRTPDSIMFYSGNGIARISKDTVGDLVAVSLTDLTIKSFLFSIIPEIRETMYGYYDRDESVVYWFMQGGRCLVFSTILGAFYYYDFGEYYQPLFDDNFARDYTMKIRPIWLPHFSYDDYNNFIGNSTRRKYSTCFLVGSAQLDNKVDNSNTYWYLTFLAPSEFGHYTDFIPDYMSNPAYQVAETPASVKANPYFPIRAHLESGISGIGDLMRSKTLFRVFSYFETTENNAAFIAKYIDSTYAVQINSSGFRPLDESECYLQAKWNWSSRKSSGKFSAKQKVYRDPKVEQINPIPFLGQSIVQIADPLRVQTEAVFPPLKADLRPFPNLAPTTDVVSSRCRVRGSGKSLSIKYSNSPARGFTLLGWGVPIFIETRP